MVVADAAVASEAMAMSFMLKCASDVSVSRVCREVSKRLDEDGSW